jgi:hypothetical protein
VKVYMPYLNSFKSLKSHTKIRHIMIRGASKAIMFIDTTYC